MYSVGYTLHCSIVGDDGACHPIRWNNEFEWLFLIFGLVFLSLSVTFALFITFVWSLSSSFSPGHVLRRHRSAIIARPLDRFQTTSRCNISLFFSFSITFIATNPHIPGLTFFPFRSPFFLMSPGLLLTNQCPSMLLTGPSFHCRCRTRFNLSILLLLIIGEIEVNPDLSLSLNLTFGLLNTRSVVNKAPLHHCLISLTMICPSWHWPKHGSKLTTPRWSKVTLHHPVIVSLMFIGTTLTKPEVVALW